MCPTGPVTPGYPAGPDRAHPCSMDLDPRLHLKREPSGKATEGSDNDRTCGMGKLAIVQDGPQRRSHDESAEGRARHPGCRKEDHHGRDQLHRSGDVVKPVGVPPTFISGSHRRGCDAVSDRACHEYQRRSPCCAVRQCNFEHSIRLPIAGYRYLQGLSWQRPVDGNVSEGLVDFSSGALGSRGAPEPSGQLAVFASHNRLLWQSRDQYDAPSPTRESSGLRPGITACDSVR